MLNDMQIAALRWLERSHRLTPSAVVEAARDAASPLHPLFEWDDDLAAEAYRLDQARAVIRTVLVTVSTTRTTVQVNRYVPDPGRGREQGYLSLDPMPDEATRRAIVVGECDRALGMVRRAAAIAAALGLADGAERAIAGLMEFRAAAALEPPVVLYDEPPAAAAD